MPKPVPRNPGKPTPGTPVKKPGHQPKPNIRPPNPTPNQPSMPKPPRR